MNYTYCSKDSKGERVIIECGNRSCGDQNCTNVLISIVAVMGISSVLIFKFL